MIANSAAPFAAPNTRPSANLSVNRVKVVAGALDQAIVDADDETADVVATLGDKAADQPAEKPFPFIALLSYHRTKRL